MIWTIYYKLLGKIHYYFYVLYIFVSVSITSILVNYEWVRDLNDSFLAIVLHFCGKKRKSELRVDLFFWRNKNMDTSRHCISGQTGIALSA